MGNTTVTVQRCCDRLQEVSVQWPDCTGADLVAQRRRVEQLIVEVDEARQENQRLNKQTNRLRVALQGAQPCPDAVYKNNNHASSHAQQSSGPSSRVQEELLLLKRTLWELQRENSSLKQGSFEDEHQNMGRMDRRVSLAQYQQLQRHLDDLQRAYDSAAIHTEKMRLRHLHQQTPSPVPSGNSQLGYTPPSVGYSGGHGGGSVRLSSVAGSCATSGVATPVDAGCGFGGSALLKPNPWGPDGGGNPLLEEELLRKMQATQAENDQLRRKVRILASK
mmetsp:Transcript_131777/g.421651  ORF Transcript_131777/g.421651 Transcript_131777/m.421651 type:complete len:277 (-) Transcript_131777:41-871(-)